MRRDTSQRAHVYEAAVEQGPVQQHMVQSLMERAFGGSARQLVLQALSAMLALPVLTWLRLSAQYGAAPDVASSAVLLELQVGIAGEAIRMPDAAPAALLEPAVEPYLPYLVLLWCLGVAVLLLLLRR